MGEILVLLDLLFPLGPVCHAHKGGVLVDAIWSSALDPESAGNCGMDVDALVSVHTMGKVLADVLGVSVGALLVLAKGVLFALDFWWIFFLTGLLLCFYGIFWGWFWGGIFELYSIQNRSSLRGSLPLVLILLFINCFFLESFFQLLKFLRKFLLHKVNQLSDSLLRQILANIP